MAKVKLKSEMEGNRRLVYFDGQSITIRKKSWIELSDENAAVLNDEVYNIVMNNREKISEEEKKFDLNRDGKIDDEDSSIAGKVLARAKSKKKKNTKK